MSACVCQLLSARLNSRFHTVHATSFTFMCMRRSRVCLSIECEMTKCCNASTELRGRCWACAFARIVERSVYIRFRRCANICSACTRRSYARVVHMCVCVICPTYRVAVGDGGGYGGAGRVRPNGNAIGAACSTLKHPAHGYNSATKPGNKNDILLFSRYDNVICPARFFIYIFLPSADASHGCCATLAP